MQSSATLQPAACSARRNTPDRRIQDADLTWQLTVMESTLLILENFDNFCGFEKLRSHRIKE